MEELISSLNEWFENRGMSPIASELIRSPSAGTYITLSDALESGSDRDVVRVLKNIKTEQDSQSDIDIAEDDIENGIDEVVEGVIGSLAKGAVKGGSGVVKAVAKQYAKHKVMSNVPSEYKGAMSSVVNAAQTPKLNSLSKIVADTKLNETPLSDLAKQAASKAVSAVTQGAIKPSRVIKPVPTQPATAQSRVQPSVADTQQANPLDLKNKATELAASIGSNSSIGFTGDNGIESSGTLQDVMYNPATPEQSEVTVKDSTGKIHNVPFDGVNLFDGFEAMITNKLLTEGTLYKNEHGIPVLLHSEESRLMDIIGTKGYMMESELTPRDQHVVNTLLVNGLVERQYTKDDDIKYIAN